MKPSIFVASVMEQLAEFLQPGQPVEFRLYVGCGRTRAGQHDCEPIVNFGENEVRFTVLVGVATAHKPEI